MSRRIAPPLEIRPEALKRTATARHEGCVNSARFSSADCGRWLVTGSDDRIVKIWDIGNGCPTGDGPELPLKHKVETAHHHNIFQADLVPSGSGALSHIITCAADGQLRQTPIGSSHDDCLLQAPDILHSFTWSDGVTPPSSISSPVILTACESGEVHRIDLRECSARCVLGSRDGDQRSSGRQGMPGRALLHALGIFDSDSEGEHNNTGSMNNPITHSSTSTSSTSFNTSTSTSEEESERGEERSTFRIDTRLNTTTADDDFGGLLPRTAAEALGWPYKRAAVKQIAVCSWQPSIIACGGASPWVRFYDLRYLSSSSSIPAYSRYTESSAAHFDGLPLRFGHGIGHGLAPLSLAKSVRECLRRADYKLGLTNAKGNATNPVNAQLHEAAKAARRRRALPDVSVSGLTFSSCRRELLVSYQSDQIYSIGLGATEFDRQSCCLGKNSDNWFGGVAVKHHGDFGGAGAHVRGVFGGHLNRDTFSKSVNYWGAQDNFVVAGSDSGHLWIWDALRTTNGRKLSILPSRRSCKNEVGSVDFGEKEIFEHERSGDNEHESDCIGNAFECEMDEEDNVAQVRVIRDADESICNGVVPHPFLPLLVSYGIDDDAKIWRAPLCLPVEEIRRARSKVSTIGHLSNQTHIWKKRRAETVTRLSKAKEGARQIVNHGGTSSRRTMELSSVESQHKWIYKRKLMKGLYSVLENNLQRVNDFGKRFEAEYPPLPPSHQSSEDDGRHKITTAATTATNLNSNGTDATIHTNNRNRAEVGVMERNISIAARLASAFHWFDAADAPVTDNALFRRVVRNLRAPLPRSTRRYLPRDPHQLCFEMSACAQEHTIMEANPKAFDTLSQCFHRSDYEDLCYDRLQNLVQEYSDDVISGAYFQDIPDYPSDLGDGAILPMDILEASAILSAREGDAALNSSGLNDNGMFDYQLNNTENIVQIALVWDALDAYTKAIRYADLACNRPEAGSSSDGGDGDERESDDDDSEKESLNNLESDFCSDAEVTMTEDSPRQRRWKKHRIDPSLSKRKVLSASDMSPAIKRRNSEQKLRNFCCELSLLCRLRCSVCFLALYEKVEAMKGASFVLAALGWSPESTTPSISSTTIVSESEGSRSAPPQWLQRHVPEALYCLARAALFADVKCDGIADEGGGKIRRGNYCSSAGLAFAVLSEAIVMVEQAQNEAAAVRSLFASEIDASRALHFVAWSDWALRNSSTLKVRKTLAAAEAELKRKEQAANGSGTAQNIHNEWFKLSPRGSIFEAAVLSVRRCKDH